MLPISFPVLFHSRFKENGCSLSRRGSHRRAPRCVILTFWRAFRVVGKHEVLVIRIVTRDIFNALLWGFDTSSALLFTISGPRLQSSHLLIQREETSEISS